MAGDGPSHRRFRRTTLRIEVEYESGGAARREVATTLGAGGLFIATENPLDEGSVLMTRFRLPQRETLHEIAGRVVWTHRKGDLPAQTSGMGISFADPASAAVLAEEIEAMLAERGARELSG